MSYSDDEQKTPEYLKNLARKEKDMYLLETVKLLNDGCANAVKYADPKKQSHDDVELYRWNIHDIDYDFAECRKYCLFTEAWDVCPDEYVSCDSCYKIFLQRIKLPFKKSKSELIFEMILLQEKMTNVLERLSKLEEANTTVLGNTLRNLGSLKTSSLLNAQVLGNTLLTNTPVLGNTSEGMSDYIS